MDNVHPEWGSVILRLMSEATSTLANNTQNGIAIVTMHVAVDGRGKPMLWVVPAGKRIEPSKDATETLINILTNNYQ